MEPNDSDLRDLLREWKTPEMSASLETRVLKRTPRWWRVLVHGYIRVPVPVACCLAILLIGGVWRLGTFTSSGCSSASAASPVVERRLPPAVPPEKPDAATACALNSTC